MMRRVVRHYVPEPEIERDRRVVGSCAVSPFDVGLRRHEEVECTDSVVVGMEERRSRYERGRRTTRTLSPMQAHEYVRLLYIPPP